MEKNLVQVAAVLGVIVPKLGEELSAKVCGPKKHTVTVDGKGRVKVDGKFAKKSPVVKAALAKAREVAFKVGVENAKSNIEADDENLHLNIDETNANDDRRRLNEMGLDDSIINKELRVSRLESWAKEVMDYIQVLRNKIQKEMDSEVQFIIEGLLANVSKASVALNAAKAEYRRQREWEIKNAWQLTSMNVQTQTLRSKIGDKEHKFTVRINPLDTRWIENSLEILAGEGGLCRIKANRAQAQYDKFMFEKEYEESLGITDGDVGYMKSQIVAKLLHAKDLYRQAQEIGVVIDLMMAGEDVSALKPWELAFAQRKLEEMSDEELVSILDLGEGGRGKLMIQDILHERLAERWMKASAKALRYTNECIDDEGSDLEMKMEAGKWQQVARSLYWAVQKSKAEYDARCAKRKANDEKFAMQRAAVATADAKTLEEIDPVVDYIEVDRFWFEDGKGGYLANSCTEVRAIHKSELPFLSEIKSGKSLLSFQGSI